MARAYRVSADMSEKEKAVGGIMTFGQAGWLVIGFVIDTIIFLALAKILPPVVALIIAAPPGVIFGCLFAFYKKGGLPLATYLRFRYAFNHQSKTMINDLIYEKKFEKEDELF